MYELIYNTIDGKVSGIRRLSDMACIPLTIWNNDYVAFLAWNDHQATPLDLNSTIPVVPPIPTRDLAKEIDKLGGVVNTDVDMITIRA